MTPEELDMMEQIHFYGKLYQLDDENIKLVIKMTKELLKEQEDMKDREDQV